ncbi:MAG TPA: hypothetical protein PLC59_00180 [Bacteroidales bacterium]|jgi:transketolase|nr:hypothetical protein [Bacteroidales bacterium]HQI44480.1 hypothetical protein [Bacteroidales bacterium]
MRKNFAKILFEEMCSEEGKKFVLLTADMGYGIWDNIRDKFPDQFYNVGAAEQLMIGMAAGFALEGKIPICYSITPFLLYRPFELIRNYMHIEKLPIKLVGSGRNKDYGYLGYTHWADEDSAIMLKLHNISISYPLASDDLTSKPIISQIRQMLHHPAPYYINLKK